MRAGTLRRVLTFQRSKNVIGELGDRIKKWTDFHKCWGAVRTITGGQDVNEDSIDLKITHIITIRFQRKIADLTPLDRVVLNDKPFKIEKIINVGERNIAIDLHCIQIYRDTE